jgi:hypothetical protein
MYVSHCSILWVVLIVEVVGLLGRSLQPFPYQCSASSTAREIERVYEAALARHDRLLKSGISTEQCVVILDEATLPKQQYAALKGNPFVVGNT